MAALCSEPSSGREGSQIPMCTSNVMLKPRPTEDEANRRPAGGPVLFSSLCWRAAMVARRSWPLRRVARSCCRTVMAFSLALRCHARSCRLAAMAFLPPPRSVVSLACAGVHPWPGLPSHGVVVAASGFPLRSLWACASPLPWGRGGSLRVPTPLSLGVCLSPPMGSWWRPLGSHSAPSAHSVYSGLWLLSPWL